MRSQGAIHLVLFLLVMSSADARAVQKGAAGLLGVTIPRVDRPPQLEDFPEMEPNEWARATLTKIEGFLQREPRDGAPASQKTEAYLGYDSKRLYAVFLCFDTEPEKIRARMLKRGDPLVFDDDFVNLYLDTFHDQRRAYVFALNPYGIQIDAIWTEQFQNFDNSFDTVWDSAGQINSRGYAVWMAIPFKSLRFPDTPLHTWGLIVERLLPRTNEASAWPHVSSRVAGRLNQAAQLQGLQDISPGRNIQLIPYGAFRSFRALDARDPLYPRFVRKLAESDGGLDTKLVLKDSLVLDVAVNPDFSHVESDEPQVTVNQRFEVFFPEKRPFFIENAGYFQTPINLVFTRRIADPRFGVRLTGKMGRTAIGALVADDESPGKTVPKGHALEGKRAWFGVARVSRDIFDQSSVGFIFTNREFENGFNRVYGIDGRLKLGKNWAALFQALNSHTRMLDGEELSGPAYDFELTRSGRKFNYEFAYSDISPGFDTQTGFLQRTDIRRLGQGLRYRFRPEGKHLIAFGPNVTTEAVYDHSGRRLNFAQDQAFAFELVGQSEAGVFYAVYRELLRPQDFPGLDESRDFSRNIRGVYFTSNYVSQLTLSGQYWWSKEINLAPLAGQMPSLADATGGRVGLVLRPGPRLSIENTYLGMRLLQRGTAASIFNNHIARSKWNWQFNRELSVRAILQYETVLANPSVTVMNTRKNFNFDFLVTYLVRPGTALYLGYNANLQNVDVVPCPSARGCSTQVVRTNRLASDARGLFMKLSYLFRF